MVEAAEAAAADKRAAAEEAEKVKRSFQARPTPWLACIYFNKYWVQSAVQAAS